MARRGRGARVEHLPFVFLSVLALLVGLWGGLVRIGWVMPDLRAGLTLAHGPLMVSGFLGTLIGLERAAALARVWAYSAPLLAGVGVVALLAGMPVPMLFAAAGLGLVVAFGHLLSRQPAAFMIVMAAGAGAWFVGNLLWLGGGPIVQTVPWLTGFLILTIVGERLELSRLVRPSRGARAVLLVAVGVYLAGLVLTVPIFALGERFAGAGMIGMSLWLLRYDIARRTIREPGLPRFIAASLLSGYVWLLIGGGLWVVLGGAVAGPTYDAMLHVVFLGFVFGMLFAHAPIIVPAVLGRAVPYWPGFYGHLALLDVSILLRLGSDLGGWTEGRRWGGLLGVLAILLFLAATAGAAASARRLPPPPQGGMRGQ
ncbi:MAG TPA: hypothetical protein VKV57_16915 [bacterium]|nr:hypothetical protein [bacterium]